MYIPKHFLIEDDEEKIEFIRSNSFGILVSIHEKEIVGSHLPMHIEKENQQVKILGHVSASNEQWKSFGENKSVLAVFQGDHAYISPSLYEEKLSVPTWNYSAVHVYGKIRTIESADEKNLILEKMIIDYEADYLNKWISFPEEYKSKMLKGIIAFEIFVEKMEGKYKLSQNKSATDREKVAHHLVNDEHDVVSGVGRKMLKGLKI